jgi:hypothetical protein
MGRPDTNRHLPCGSGPGARSLIGSAEAYQAFLWVFA